jgi:hypothetical protein
MAIPVQPSLSVLCTEGIKRSGYPSPSSAQITRAESWIEEIKWDIWDQAKKYKSLLVTSYGVTTKGISRYANPSDFESDLSINILDGEHQGTLEAATSCTATLASDETITEDMAQGKLLLMTSGNTVGSCSQISAYDATTKIATVIPDFYSTPAGTEDYMVVDFQRMLSQQHIIRREAESYPFDKSIPEYYFPLGQGTADSDETGEFELYPTPDDIYGIQLRYYANLMLVDLSSNLMATLYRRWRNLFIQGVMMKSLQNDRDARYVPEMQIYNKMLQDLKSKEVYGMDLNDMRRTVEE